MDAALRSSELSQAGRRRAFTRLPGDVFWNVLAKSARGALGAVPGPPRSLHWAAAMAHMLAKAPQLVELPLVSVEASTCHECWDCWWPQPLTMPWNSSERGSDSCAGQGPGASSQPLGVGMWVSWERV